MPTNDGGVDPHVLKAIAKAWSWRRKLETGAVGTISDIAQAEDISDRYVGRMLRLAYLAPVVLEIHASACKRFGTVLGPAYNQDHADTSTWRCRTAAFAAKLCATASSGVFLIAGTGPALNRQAKQALFRYSIIWLPRSILYAFEDGNLRIVFPAGQGPGQ